MEPNEHASSIQESVCVGIVCIHPELCGAILQAVSDAGMRTIMLDSVKQLQEPDLPCDIAVIYSGIITSELLTIVAEATSPPGRHILVVSWDRDPQHIADLLRAGADDFLSAPFASEELIARIMAVTSRAITPSNGIGHRNIVFDFATRSIITGDQHISLSAQEWGALLALLDAEGRTLTVKELSHSLPGHPSSGAVIALLSRLRRKLKSRNFDAVSIDTVRGFGYSARLEHEYNPTGLSGNRFNP